MYYLVEGYQVEPDKRLELGTPRRTQAVTIQQLVTTINGMFRDSCGHVVVSEIDEATFIFFYQERSEKARERRV